MQNNKVYKIDDQYSFLDEATLRKDYLENNLNDGQIAKKYGIGSKATVWRRRIFFGIGNRYPNKTNKNAFSNRKFTINESDARSMLEAGLNCKEIAKTIGCSVTVAYRRLKEIGLIVEKPCNMKKLRLHEKLSEKQEKFLIGSLLGDGNITNNGIFQCNHSDKQKEYVEYKSEILKSLTAPNFKLKTRNIKNNQNGKTYSSILLRTMQNENLKEMYCDFYHSGKKIFPLDLLMSSSFDDYSLAIWYMDDGSRCKNTCSLQTQGFNYADNLKVIEFLYKKFNISGVIQEIRRSSSPVNPNHRHYVRFNKDDAYKLFSIVAPHMIPSMSYKLPIEMLTPSTINLDNWLDG